MSKVITVTLNPAFDIFYDTDLFEVGKENLLKTVLKTVGGKGINVSKALSANEIDNTAVFLSPKDGGSEICEEMFRLGIGYAAVPAEGRVRENITVRETSGRDTRIAVNTFSASPAVLSDALSAVSEKCEDGTVIVFSGKFPKNVGREERLTFLNSLKSLSPRLVIDSSSVTAEETVAIKPWLIKPNEQEIKAFGQGDDLFGICRNVRKNGVKNILLTLGKDGAIYCGEDGEYEIKTPAVKPVSTVGAGDATVAGFVYSTVNGFDNEKKLKYSCAFGTSACLEEGTDAPKPENIERFADLVSVRKI